MMMTCDCRRYGSLSRFSFGLTFGGAAQADAAFQHWLQGTWPQAQQLGVSRATFDAAIRGLEPDLSLPDLAIPGKPEKQPQQAEFVQTPAQYLREPTFDRPRGAGQETRGAIS